MQLLKKKHELTCPLVNGGQSTKMSTLQDLITYITACAAAKLKHSGSNNCMDLDWGCEGSTEQELRQVARHLKQTLDVEMVVKERSEGALHSVVLIKICHACIKCNERVECLMSERLK